MIAGLVFDIAEKRKTGVRILHDLQVFFMRVEHKSELLFICAYWKLWLLTDVVMPAENNKEGSPAKGIVRL